uniref:Uncharacterized protein n=1 Tax=uncultured Chloroflexota bacterium TaxID=166587 RepID=H5SLA5_9CHLR|nr:hypothetical protein HGMM_F45G04C14 [uncultured Chloroflexota bacterium]
MRTGNVYLVLLLAFLIVVLSNLLTYFIVRGGRGLNFQWFQRLRQGFRLSADEDQAWEELNRRVRELRERQGQDRELPPSS